MPLYSCRHLLSSASYQNQDFHFLSQCLPFCLLRLRLRLAAEGITITISLVPLLSNFCLFLKYYQFFHIFFCFCVFLFDKKNKNFHTIISYKVLNKTTKLNRFTLFLQLNCYSLLHFLTMKNLRRRLYLHWQILENFITVYMSFKQSDYQYSAYRNIHIRQILYFAFELKTNFP